MNRIFGIALKLIFLSAFAFIISFNQVCSQSNQWAWMKGDTTETVINHAIAHYGILGIADTANRPGSREGGVTWKDNAGNQWLFGGFGLGVNNNGFLNDLWMYNPLTNKWTWVKGDSLIDKNGVYGILNTASPLTTAKPGSRTNAVSWTDASGNFWLFGGIGFANSGGLSRLNDLWKFNVTTKLWTWVKGDSSQNKVGVYGILNTVSPLAVNKPGARSGAVGWKDTNGNFWLFGGEGFAKTGSLGYMNDLWKYNPSMNLWTWVHGDSLVNQVGVSGNITIPAAANKPGARYLSTSMTDASGRFWLFGGAAFTPMYFNDLWVYNPANNQWTWMKGNNYYSFGGFEGDYGLLGVSSSTNNPGSRIGASGWRDNTGNLWLFGGNGRNENFGSYDMLNDLWKYNLSTNEWTWIKGSSNGIEHGNNGIAGVPNQVNTPGSRMGESQTWTDASGNLWLFGGNGYGDYNVQGYLNELWIFNPITQEWTWKRDNSRMESFFASNYGSSGITTNTNKPGGRYGAGAWSDISGEYWLFGGYGKSGVDTGLLNDLWKYNSANNQWTWIHGDSVQNKYGNYGITNVPDAANKPGSREGATTWTDSNGNLWLFGGYGYGSTGIKGYLNDLWKFNKLTKQWTWVKGGQGVNSLGIYGTIGVTNPANNPGGRQNAVGNWVDANGNLWLMGGKGNASIEPPEYENGYLNDLWRYNPSNNEWTWMKGSDTYLTYPLYGTKGLESDNGKPGGRYKATSFMDTAGNFYLFGGIGVAGGGVYSVLNDLWKYIPSSNKWVWITGDTTGDNSGVYSAMGMYAFGNKPGSRYGASCWVDSDNNMLLFGGFGRAADPDEGNLNDLWKYNFITNQWSWISGKNTLNNLNVYGTQSLPGPNNNPGGRYNCVTWKGGNASFWLFGGNGLTNASSQNQLNDVWKLNTPCSGSIILNPIATSPCYNGGTINLTATGGTSYEWYKNGVLIAGVTGSSYSANSAGSYYVKGNVGSCTGVYSNEILLQNPPITPSLGGTGVYCLGDPVNVGIPQTEPDQDYTWLRNNGAVFGPIGGNGGNQSLQFNMDFGRSGTYIVESRKTGCNNVFSNNVYVGLAEIIGLSASIVCTDQISFSWNRVLPSFVPQKYEYAVTTSPFPPSNGVATTSVAILVSSLLPGTSYYIHVRSACGFDLTNFGNWNTLQVTTESTPLPANTAEWSGSYDQNWTDSRNWKCGVVPGATSIVNINGGKPNYPYLANNVIVKSLNLNPGADMEIAPGFKITVTSQ